MFTVVKTDVFDEWLSGLADQRARARIILRIRNVEMGNLGDCKPVGEGVSELRVDYGPGYRVYFIRDGLVVYVLLCAGQKRTQKKDITRAHELAREWRGQKL